MMETVLNLGLNDRTRGLAKQSGNPRFARLVPPLPADVRRRPQPGVPAHDTRHRPFPKSGAQTLTSTKAPRNLVADLQPNVNATGRATSRWTTRRNLGAVEAVFRSDARRPSIIASGERTPTTSGTAVNICTMVSATRGELGTGVAFTATPPGERTFYGDYLERPGWDVVAGIRNTLALAALEGPTRRHTASSSTSCGGWSATTATSGHRVHHRARQALVLQTAESTRTGRPAARRHRNARRRRRHHARRGDPAGQRRDSSTSCCTRSSTRLCTPAPGAKA